jgi:hypothetical protein
MDPKTQKMDPKTQRSSLKKKGHLFEIKNIKL